MQNCPDIAQKGKLVLPCHLWQCEADSKCCQCAQVLRLLLTVRQAHPQSRRGARRQLHIETLLSVNCRSLHRTETHVSDTSSRWPALPHLQTWVSHSMEGMYSGCKLLGGDSSQTADVQHKSTAFEASTSCSKHAVIQVLQGKASASMHRRCKGRTVVMPTGGALSAISKSKRRTSIASDTTASNSANWSPAMFRWMSAGGGRAANCCPEELMTHCDASAHAAARGCMLHCQGISVTKQAVS